MLQLRSRSRCGVRATVTALLMAASGLRSSCASMARNSSFRRSASRSRASATLRVVMSSTVPTCPMAAAASLSMGLLRTCTQRVSPWQVYRDSQDQGSPLSTAVRHDTSVSAPRPSLIRSAHPNPMADSGAPPVVACHTGLAYTQRPAASSWKMATGAAVHNTWKRPSLSRNACSACWRKRASASRSNSACRRTSRRFRWRSAKTATFALRTSGWTGVGM